MHIKPPVEHLNEPVLRFARKDFTTLNQRLTMEQVLAAIRQRGVGDEIAISMWWMTMSDWSGWCRRADY